MDIRELSNMVYVLLQGGKYMVKMECSYWKCKRQTNSPARGLGDDRFAHKGILLNLLRALVNVKSIQRRIPRQFI